MQNWRIRDWLNHPFLVFWLMASLLPACGGSAASSGSAATASTSSSSVANTTTLSTSANGSTISTVSSSPSTTLVSLYSSRFVLGADLSWASEMETNGLKFYTAQGVQQDVFPLMKSLGMNAVRLRVWVNPADTRYNTIQDVIAKAQRAKTQGQRVMIDFHYSDNWADPGKQAKPALWAALSISDLKMALANHTRTSLTALRDAGITPEWVQVGNETNDGFLWNDARPSTAPQTTTMKNYADLTTAGYDAVKEIFPNALVIVHLANCHKNDNFRWIFDGLKLNKAKFDMIGASSYPTTEPGVTWQTVTANCLANLNDMVDRYGVPVMMTEVGVPWDLSAGKTIIADLITKVASVKNGKGMGVFYWEPEAYNMNGYSMGAFDTKGKPTAIMDAFTEASARIAQ